MSNSEFLCFVPINGEIKEGFKIITGMNFITPVGGNFPKGKIVAVVHEKGQDYVNDWNNKNEEVLKSIKEHNAKV